jgi:hypothetical protein
LPGAPRDRGITLKPGLGRAAVLSQRLRKPRRRLLALGVDALVKARDVLLLTADLSGWQQLSLPAEPRRKIAWQSRGKTVLRGRVPVSRFAYAQVNDPKNSRECPCEIYVLRSSMADAQLPREGPVRLGSVSLPAGRLWWD